MIPALRYTCFLLISILLVNFCQAQVKGNLISQAEYEMSRGRVTAAIDLLNAAIERQPGVKRAFLFRGIAKYQLNDMVGAESDLNVAIEANPRNHEAYLYRAESRFSTQRYNEGLADLKFAIKLDSTDIRLYTSMAVANMRLDKSDQVITTCDKGLNIAPKNTLLLTLRGEAKANMSLFRIALDDFQKAYELDTTDQRPKINTAMAYNGLELYDESLETLNEILRKYPENAYAIFQRGRTYMKMKKSELAQFDLDRVIELRPDNSIAYFNRGIILSDKKDWNAALTDYTKVIQLNPKNILAFFNRGLIHLQKKNLELAQKDLERTIELYPDFLDAHEVLSQVYQDQKNKAGFDSEQSEMAAINARNFQKDEALKYHQKMQLLRLTNFRGSFADSGPSDKIPSVELDLAPSFKCTLFPEENEGFIAYDGWKKPALFNQIIAAINNTEAASDSLIRAFLSNITINGASAKNEWKKAVALIAIGDFSLAKKHLIVSLELDPDQAISHFTIAQVQHHLLEEEEENITARYFGDSPTPSYQAHLNKADSVYKGIIQNYQKALDQIPDLHMAAFNLGNVLAENRQFEDAISQYSVAIRANPKLAEAFYNRGQLYLLLDKTDESCKDLSAAGQLGFVDAYGLIKRFCD
ncbi:MAG: tetratricopeptide (TPR) repeat protein [Flavobacteriales bacterium]|jgi:tetratricopeptide (TPR) repeat protein